MSWPQAAPTRVLRVRRAALKAVARVHAAPEPTDAECDDARWDAGLAAAYRSLPGRSVALAAPASAPALPVLQAPARRAPLAWALGTGLAAFALGLRVLPGTALWETRGHLPIPTRLGVPGGPDSIPFAALARAWSVALAPLAGPEVALTLFAVAAVGALASTSFLSLQWMAWRALGRDRPSVAIAVVLTLLGVFALLREIPSVSSANEQVLTATALIAAAWGVFRWLERRSYAGSARHLLIAGYFAAIAFTAVAPLALPVGSALLLALRFRPKLLSA